MRDGERIARSINVLGDFCGARDVAALDGGAARVLWGAARADWLVLFGGSILAGGDVLAEAVRAGVAQEYMIVGGEGHTTGALREAVARETGINTAGLSEADCFAGYLRTRYGVEIPWLERESTNCGNNVTNCLALMRQSGLAHRRVIIMQDATMQRRMAAGFALHAPEMAVASFAACRARVEYADGAMRYAEAIHGMWPVTRYVSMLMGEIVRLEDGPEGYGPRGKGFIAHVEIGEDVREAVAVLRDGVGDVARGMTDDA